MPSIKKLTPDFAVAPQIQVEDIAALVGQGFKTIINNRPDNEEAGQPFSAQIAEEAARQGIRYQHIPVISGKLSEDHVIAFADAMKNLPKPIFAYCRSGTRSTTLWALSEAPHSNVDTILKTAHSAGYDLSTLRPRLEAAKR